MLGQVRGTTFDRSSLASALLVLGATLEEAYVKEKLVTIIPRSSCHNVL